MGGARKPRSSRNPCRYEKENRPEVWRSRRQCSVTSGAARLSLFGQREGVHSTLAAVIGGLLMTPYSVKLQAPHAGRLNGGESVNADARSGVQMRDRVCVVDAIGGGASVRSPPPIASGRGGARRALTGATILRFLPTGGG